MMSTPTAPGVIRQADVHHEPSCMGNGLLNHDPAAVAGIRRGVMKAVRWEGTKRQIRQISPPCDIRTRWKRESAAGRNCAEQRGHQLAQLRKNSGLTQVQVAGAMGVSQTRVSQIGHGKITESDASRTYSEAPALQSARRWPGAVSDWARAVGEPVRRRTYWHDTKRGSRPWPEARTSAAPPTLSPATPLPARRRPGTR